MSCTLLAFMVQLFGSHVDSSISHSGNTPVKTPPGILVTVSIHVLVLDIIIYVVVFSGVYATLE